MAAKTKTPIAYTNEQIVNAATGRWGEVAHDVKPAEPYQIAVPESDKVIIVKPLTPKRRRALKAAQAAYIMVGSQLAEAQNTGAAADVLTRIEQLLEDADKGYNAALFGEVAEEVVELFDEIDEAYWNAMYEDIHKALVNRVEVPEGKCSKCGQDVPEDDEEADLERGKD